LAITQHPEVCGFVRVLWNDTIGVSEPTLSASTANNNRAARFISRKQSTLFVRRFDQLAKNPLIIGFK
jgi:hypothetical protein